MIKNDRQLAISKKKLNALRSAADRADEFEEAVLNELILELERDIEEYVDVRDGATNVFPVDSIDHLAHALIKARISRHWTQAQLGETVGVSEQMIQADEAGGYERAGLARLADVADALEYTLRGELVPTDCPPSRWFRHSDDQEASSTSRWTMPTMSVAAFLGGGSILAGGSTACSFFPDTASRLGLLVDCSWSQPVESKSASTSRSTSEAYVTTGALT